MNQFEDDKTTEIEVERLTVWSRLCVEIKSTASLFDREWDKIKWLLMGQWVSHKIKVKEGDVFCGESGRYFVRVGDRPTINGPKTYFITVFVISGRSMSYESRVFVNEHGHAQLEVVSKLKLSKLKSLKKEIWLGYLSKCDELPKPIWHGGEL